MGYRYSLLSKNYKGRESRDTCPLIQVLRVHADCQYPHHYVNNKNNGHNGLVFTLEGTGSSLDIPLQVKLNDVSTIYMYV